MDVRRLLDTSRREAEGKEVNIEIYTAPGCPLCDQAKALCKMKGLPFTETAIGSNRGMAMLHHYPMVRQMPAVFINGERVGGFEGLKHALQQVGL